MAGTSGTVVVGVTASAAIYKSCEVIRRIKDHGFRVTVVQTPESAKLISPVLFGSIAGSPVYTEMFSDPAAWDIHHVSLAREAVCVVVAPATANVIAKLACGIADDVLTCLILATTAPVLVCPAMNTNMYRHPATQKNLRELKKFGYEILGPVEGKLACGESGTGCLADPSEIAQSAEKLANSSRHSARGRGLRA